MPSEPMWRRYRRWWGVNVAADVDAELQLHRELLIDDYLARGCQPDEALVLAERRLGDLARVRATCVTEGRRWEHQKARQWMWHQLVQDVRFALRLLIRTPSTTIVALVTIALAIGATTTIYSVVHSVLIRPLPFPAADRLVQVRLDVTFQTEPAPMSAADFLAWQFGRDSFDEIAVYSVSSFNITGAGAPEAAVGGWVSAGFFDLLGTTPALGRLFLPDDERWEAESVIVLSDGFWRRYFGADPGVLGRSISVTGTPSTIVGVLPPGFSFPQPNIDLWRNGRSHPQRRGPFFLTGIGRLKAGMTIAQAEHELRLVKDHVRRQYPGPDDWAFAVRPLHDAVVGNVRPVLWLLFGAVSVLLLIAVVNVANLLLARAASRSHEIGIRTALGAGRARLVRQLLTESVLLAAVGGVLGIGLAIAGTAAVIAFGADRIPRSTEISLDLRVLAFTAIVSVLAGLLFGLAPALHAFRREALEMLRAGTRSGTAVLAHRRHQATLVVVQVALAIVLMVGAALLTRSLLHLARHDPGFRSDNLLTFYLDLPSARYNSDELMIGFYDRLFAALRAFPGVEAVTATNSLPPHLLSVSDNFIIDGLPVPPGQTPPVAPLVIVADDFFQALGIPLLRGRTFAASDRASTEPVAIISRTLARQYFGDDDPIGRRLRTGPERKNWPWLTIVGVVGDVPYTGLDAEPQPAYYLPASQSGWGDYYVVIRTARDPASVGSAARAAVWSIDSELPVGAMNTMDQRIRDALGAQTFRTTLVGLFALLGFVLAGVGIYGVMSYMVGQRMPEFGVRAALGAQPDQILRLVLSSGLRLAVTGVLLGCGVAVLSAHVLSGLLFGIGPRDPGTFAAVVVLTLALSIIATLTPAWRAMRVDPLRVLRQD